MYSSKSIVKQVFLNLKTFVSNKENIFIFFFFMFLAILIPMIFVPLRLSFAVTLIVFILPLNATLYYSSSFSYKNSTLFLNTNLSKNKIFLFEISVLFSMITISLIATFILFLFVAIFNQFNLFLINWWTYTDPSNFNEGSELYQFNILIFFVIEYCSIFFSLAIYSISYFISSLTNNSKTYFFIILAILILTVIFGGILNDYFYFNTDPEAVDKELGWSRHHGLFPPKAFPISFLFPFYSHGEVVNAMVGMSRLVYDNETNEWISKYEEFGTSSQLIFDLFFNSGDLVWEISLYFPYLEILIFIIAGKLITINKN